MSLTILLIGSGKGKHLDYAAALGKPFDLLTAQSGKQAIELAKIHPPRAVILDAHSMGSTGERICRALHADLIGTPVVHIHPGPRSSAQSTADVVLFLPLSPRRLVTTVERLVRERREEVIECGPFSMNVNRRVLIAHGKETQLTPKQTRLMETFLRNPGATIDRKTLMQRVWDTNYMGDTRTLDVHIRWIRQLLEQNSSTPSYLQTVRGVGYRLVLPQPEFEPILM
jgi:DNA-binding response OmpR family regulator